MNSDQIIAFTPTTNSLDGKIINHLDIDDSLVNQILEFGHLTGSVAFGCATANSDYDVIYIKRNEAKIMNIIGSERKMKKCEYFSGFKIEEHVNDVKYIINIIPISFVDYIPWCLATQDMKMVCSIEPNSMVKVNKTIRHGLFMSLVSTYKIALSNMEPNDIAKWIANNKYQRKIKSIKRKFNDNIWEVMP